MADFSNVVLDDCFQCYCEIPSIDSLSFDNQYSRDFYDDLCRISLEKPLVTIMGKAFDTPEICSCLQPPYYILDGHLSYNILPVRCGGCHKRIPLYQFPKIFAEDEYFTVLNWCKEYLLYDKLYNLSRSRSGEQYAYRQLSGLKSSLSQLGMQICFLWEKEMNTPFYYSILSNKTRKDCPMCNTKTETDPSNSQNRICKKCRIIIRK